MMAWFVVIAFMGFAVLGLIEIRKVRRRIARLRQGRPVPAVVVGHEQLPESNKRPVRYPVVQFDDPAGEPVTARSDFGGDFVPATGRRVVVLLDPDKPDIVHIESRMYDRLQVGAAVLFWTFIVAGVAFIVTRSESLMERIFDVAGLAGWRESATLPIGLLLNMIVGTTVGALLILYARRLAQGPQRAYRDGQNTSSVVVDYAYESGTQLPPDQAYLTSGFRTSRRNTLIAAVGWITVVGFPLGSLAVLIAVSSLL